jgi:hypothetical protein
MFRQPQTAHVHARHRRLHHIKSSIHLHFVLHAARRLPSPTALRALSLSLSPEPAYYYHPHNPPLLQYKIPNITLPAIKQVNNSPIWRNRVGS